MIKFLYFTIILTQTINAAVMVDGQKVEGLKRFNLKRKEVTSTKKAPIRIHTQTIKGLRYLHINRTETIEGSFDRAVAFYEAFGTRCDNTLAKKRYFLKNKKDQCEINQEGMIEYVRIKNLSNSSNNEITRDSFIAGISVLPFSSKRYKLPLCMRRYSAASFNVNN